MEGDTVSAIFLLKTRHGYREGAELVNATPGERKNNIAGARWIPMFHRKKLEVQNAD
jgi:hypothetical protein